VAFGLRIPLSAHLLAFAAGTYAVDHDGVRPAGVSPVLGIAGELP